MSVIHLHSNTNAVLYTVEHLELGVSDPATSPISDDFYELNTRLVGYLWARSMSRVRYC